MNNKLFKHISTFGFLFFGIIAFGQEFEFDIQNTSLSAYIQMEEQLGSEKITTTSNHISFSGDAQPIKYKRKETLIPDLVTSFHFKEKDSTMSKVLYEWDVKQAIGVSKEGEKQSKEFQVALIQKYNDLEKKLTALYGIPTSKGDLSDITLADQKNGLKKNDKWYPNEHTEIELYIVVSNFYKETGIFTLTPTYRIRLYIRSM